MLFFFSSNVVKFAPETIRDIIFTFVFTGGANQCGDTLRKVQSELMKQDPFSFSLPGISSNNMNLCPYATTHPATANY